MKATIPLLVTIVTLAFSPTGIAQDVPRATTGSAELDAYFEYETRRIESGSLRNVKSAGQWASNLEAHRSQLEEMLGLSPFPERTDLQPVITGVTEHEDFIVEKLHFQSLPGLYVTGNLYLPKNITEPLPAILYVCGHGQVKIDGVSHGNKVNYQHHGEWFVRNGYVCLTIDTIQLGELEGLHHGTYREGMWWWNARGYTPAGVEAWNCIRALDYLETRPEVDSTRFGVTGRSGGGAYSWWISALDDRIKCSVPVAGITDLRDHVVDGVVEGHCDCMFMVNTHRWDYAKVAALVAPRPLLIANTDKDSIFPLDGVMRVHSDVRHIYELMDAGDKLGVLITEGPHKDTQDLQVPAFRWFNRWLKGDTEPVGMVAEKLLEPAQLKVFDALPSDERTTKIHESFVSRANPRVPKDRDEWESMRDGWMNTLRKKVFAGWPDDPGPLDLKQAFSAERDGLHIEALDFNSQRHVRLRAYLMRRAGTDPSNGVTMKVLDEDQWVKMIGGLRKTFARELGAEIGLLPEGIETSAVQEQLSEDTTVIAIAPRGIGLTRFVDDARKRVQIKRRFQLLGQTLDSMRVWDIIRATEAIRSMPDLSGSPLRLSASADMGVNALYASLFVDSLETLELSNLPASHMNGPDYLNILRFLDIPQALAMAVEIQAIFLRNSSKKTSDYASSTSLQLDRPSSSFSIQHE